VETEEEHGSPVCRGRAGHFGRPFFHGEGQQKFPETGGWGYAQFDYDTVSATFSADKAGTPNCGQVCHVAVKAKDYVFHPYQMR
jgi:hypothetical protein